MVNPSSVDKSWVLDLGCLDIGFGVFLVFLFLFWSFFSKILELNIVVEIDVLDSCVLFF